MDELKIYKGLGTADMREDLIDFLNYTFGYNGFDSGFLQNYPKLYNPEYNPCEHNYVVTENNKLKAAVGVYPRTLSVLGTEISLYGIGNVGVHPCSRSKGYMKDLMDMAIQDMIREGADMSDLGGLRQRYQYFSYEVAGIRHWFHFDNTSMRHCFRDVPFKALQFVAVDKNSPILPQIIDLYNNNPFHVIRSDDQFFDIVSTGRRTLHAIFDGERFVGYFLSELSELRLVSLDDFNDVMRNYVAAYGKARLALPAHETEWIDACYKICHSFDMHNDQNYTIFHYKKVIESFMKLKASRLPLFDGTLTLQIHGICGTETLTIRVCEGNPSVDFTNKKPDIILEHTEAVSFLFGLSSPARQKHALAAAWFPLPLMLNMIDHV